MTQHSENDTAFARDRLMLQLGEVEIERLEKKIAHILVEEFPEDREGEVYGMSEGDALTVSERIIAEVFGGLLMRLKNQ